MVTRMAKRRKIQVVLIHRPSRTALLLKTNVERGSFTQNITGSVDESESFQMAAMRELMEETGVAEKIVMKDLELEFSFVDRRGDHVVEKCYVAIWEDKREKILLDPSEHDSYEFKDLSKIKASDYHYETNFSAFQKAYEYLGKIF
jgi:8-oxo-dGTP pyrophosphatase MutT (NUDIX family)